MEKLSYYQRNREKILEKSRLYRESHREILNEKAKEYQREHKEERDKYKKEYYEKNCERLKKKTKKWKEDNSFYYLASRRARAYKAMDAKKGWDTSNNVDAKWMQENILNGENKCIYCGETDILKLGCDRIDNLKPHTPENVVCSCYACNVEREARKRTIENFVEYKRAVRIVEGLIRDGKLDEALKKYLDN